MRLRTFLYALVLGLFTAVAGSAAHASSITYDFTYSGVGTLANATGSGSFTYDTVTRDLTAFAFTDKFSTIFGSAGTFTYGLGDIAYQGMLLFQNGTLFGIDITTNAVAANSGSHGLADFTLNYASGAAIDATTGSKFGQNTIGSGTMTLVSTVNPAATPEPSSLMLLGTGILGVAEFVRRKARA